MNLVAYEYIATQQKRHGVLVLSEFAGAAQSLNGSIIVNPWNTEELAGAYQEAVTMSDEQRALNFAKLDRYVSKYTRYVKCQIPYSTISNQSTAHSGANPSSPNSPGYQHIPPKSSNRKNCPQQKTTDRSRVLISVSLHFVYGIILDGHEHGRGEIYGVFPLVDF